MKKLLSAVLICLFLNADAQVKIGNNPGTIDANSLLEMESTNKGFLAPRVTLTALNNVSPLTGTVPAGMMIFNAAGSLPNGYYYWDGSEWKKLSNGNKDIYTKTADVTLLKSENYIVTNNDLIITLPVVTVADNGLSITIKNIGSHTDLAIVKGSGAAMIDGVDSVNITKNVALNFVALAGNWIISNSKKTNLQLMEVDEKSSWANIEEAIEFLDEHMLGPTVIKLSDESYPITNTLTIDLPYSLTIQGNSYGSANIEAGAGLTGKPMFRCLSDAYFKMLHFDATTLANYGNNAGEDAIRFLGSGTYNEVKDASFDGFNTTILDSTDAELWVFEVDIINAKANGIMIHSAEKYTSVKVAETDFINCKVGVRLSKGDSATIQLASGVYYGENNTDTAIIYQPSTFTNPESISITGNSWNNIGGYITGFDFTRSDGRDANFKVETNAGAGDNIPYCFVNKLNATTGVSVSTGVWIKANWGSNDDEFISKWTVSSNRITYQPTNSRNGLFTISGNMKVNSSNKNIQIAIVKNGNSSVRYGETTLRTVTSNQPYQFSFIAFLPNIQKDDYFEIWYTVNGNQTLTIEDLQWLVTAQ